ncbi:HORMA-1 domain-containing protein [Limimaricola variabilis]
MSSFSTTFSSSTTFTLTHAKHMAAKVATDLQRMHDLYGQPFLFQIDDHEAEIAALLRAGYLDTVTYGFKRGDSWIEPTLRYTARDLMGASAADDDPGRIRPGKNISGASFYSFLTYSPTWHALPEVEKARFEGSLPFSRTTANEPGISGYLSSDKTYSAGGHALDRTTVRSF